MHEQLRAAAGLLQQPQCVRVVRRPPSPAGGRVQLLVLVVVLRRVAGVRGQRIVVVVVVVGQGRETARGPRQVAEDPVVGDRLRGPAGRAPQADASSRQSAAATTPGQDHPPAAHRVRVRDRHVRTSVQGGRLPEAPVNPSTIIRGAARHQAHHHLLLLQYYTDACQHSPHT